MGAIALLEADVQNAVLLGRRIGFSRRLEWCGGDNNGMRRGCFEVWISETRSCRRSLPRVREATASPRTTLCEETGLDLLSKWRVREAGVGRVVMLR